MREKKLDREEHTEIKNQDEPRITLQFLFQGTGFTETEKISGGAALKKKMVSV